MKMGATELAEGAVQVALVAVLAMQVGTESSRRRAGDRILG